MASNHKLTGVIKGRTIASTQNQDNKLLIGFTDGSTMTVKTAGNTNSASTGGVIKAVRQQDTKLTLDLANGASWEIPLEAPTSSVVVRDKNHALEYLD